MTIPTLMPSPRQKFTDSNGVPLANGMLFTYAAGTSTPLAAYQDPTGTVAHANPIRLDARGEATVYFIGNYKIDLKTSAGSQITGYPVDNFSTPDLMAPSNAVRSDLAAAGGSALMGFTQGGAGAASRQAQDKLREVPVSITDYAGMVFTATAKDVADGHSHSATSFPSWRMAIQKALDVVFTRGGGTVLVPFSTTPYLVDDAITVKANTRLVFEGEIKLADYTTIGAILIVNGDNITISNPRIDGSSIYAGGSGQNGVGVLGGNHVRIDGGKIRNCARGQDFITPGSPNDGGKAVQIEDGAGEDIVVNGTSMVSCFMAMSTIRDGGTTNPYYGIVYSNIKADNCSILFFVRQANINSTDGLQHTIQLCNFYAVNCGAFEGAMQFSRASNVLVSNGIVVNDPAVVATSLIRGNHRNSRFENIMFSGNAGSIVNLDPGTYSPDNSYPPANNTYDIHHMGTVDFIVNSTSAVDTKCTGKFQLENDVVNGFFGFALRNGNSTFLVSQGGKSAFVGTNTNFHPSSAVIKFSQLPLNYSVPLIQSNAVKFPAIQIASADPNALDDYEENDPATPWVPVDASGASLSLVTAYGDFTKIGRLVTASLRVIFPSTANSSGAQIGGLPFVCASNSGRSCSGFSLRFTDQGGAMTGVISPGGSSILFYKLNGVAMTNSELSGKTIDGMATYFSA